MPPLPKKKTPNSRRGKRRSHMRLRPATLTECSHCHAKRPAHQVCPNCGYYGGREAVPVAEPELPE